MTHPLTDETIENIAPSAQWAGDIGDTVFRHDDMRAAADWQLEQVIDWLKECPSYDLETYAGLGRMIQDLKTAMRPQEDNQ